MLRRLRAAVLVVVALCGSHAHAQPACLPLSALAKTEEPWRQPFELGFVADTPTLCLRPPRETPQDTTCWSVDPKTGALSHSSATHLPGLGRWRKADLNGCVDGLCTGPMSDAEEPVLWAASTTEPRAVIFRDTSLLVFDTASKALTATIVLIDEKTPSHTNVSNMPVRLLFQGDTIYVVGSDAGPYMAVWAFKQDGTRLGLITESGKPDDTGLSVYNGTANMLDGTHVIAADAGLRKAVIVSTPNGARDMQTRRANDVPCTRDETSSVDIGDIDQLSRACKRAVSSRLVPYFNAVMIRLPSGELLAALSGKGRGSLAVLDRATLQEKRRLKLQRCPK